MPFSRRSLRPPLVVARARLLIGVAAASLLTPVACLDDSPTAPALSGVNLQIAATIGVAEPDWTVAIRVYYYRQNESQVDLPIDPDTVYLEAGQSVDQPVAVDIAPCLADPTRADFEGEGESGGCRFYVELQLIDGDGEVLSEDTNDAFASTPGETVEVEPFVLPPGEITVSSTTASITSKERDDPPLSVGILVGSSTSHSLGTLSAEIEYQSGSGWLEAIIQQSEGSAVILRVTTTELAVGTYKATVTLTSSAGHTPATIAVTYTVTPRDKIVTIAGAGNGDGSITVAGTEDACVSLAGQLSGECTPSAPHGTQLTLHANPRFGSSFAGWSGACTGTEPCTFAMDQDRAVTATFTLLPRRLTVTLAGTGAGAVTSSPTGIACSRATGQAPVTCNADFLHLTAVTLTAAASPTSTFAGWSGGGCTGTAPCTVTMDQAKTVTATFNVAVHKLTIVGSGTGNGVVISKPTGIDCRVLGGRSEGACAADFPIGAQVTLTATPDEGHSFDGYDNLDCGRTCTVPMHAPLTVTVTFVGPPPPGRDIVVFNDLNVFDAGGMASPSNQTMVRNLLNYSDPGPRSTGNVVLFDCTRGGMFGSDYCNAVEPVRAFMRNNGFTVQQITSSSGSLTSFASNVKAIFLYLGCAAFTPAEVNALKQFASEGGRIIYVGEYASLYSTACINIENTFLKNLGAVMTNVGNDIDCGRVILPPASLRAHQITQGMTEVSIACSSEIRLGPNDFALYYDLTNTRVLSGVARIDVTPMPTSGVVITASSHAFPPATVAAPVDNARIPGAGPLGPPRQ